MPVCHPSLFPSPRISSVEWTRPALIRAADLEAPLRQVDREDMNIWHVLLPPIGPPWRCSGSIRARRRGHPPTSSVTSCQPQAFGSPEQPGSPLICNHAQPAGFVVPSFRLHLCPDPAAQRWVCAWTISGTTSAGGVLRLRPQRTTPSITTIPTPGRSPAEILDMRSLPELH